VEVHRVAMSTSLKCCNRIRGLWLQVTGRKGDELGVREKAIAYYGWTVPYQLWQAFRELEVASVLSIQLVSAGSERQTGPGNIKYET
jgi:hypothetical protein